jgi:anthranilate synthase component 1
VTALTLVPGFDDFVASYEADQPTLIVTKLISDLETPVSAYLKLSRNKSNAAFLLESVEGGAARGRYSMIGLNPDIIFKVVGDKAQINRNALNDASKFMDCDAPPLIASRNLIHESSIPHSMSLPPMSAGVFGYLGYDMVRQMERLAPAKSDKIGAPDALLIRPTIMVVFDTVCDELYVVTPVRPTSSMSAMDAYDSAYARLNAIVTRLNSPLEREEDPAERQIPTQEAVSNTPTHRFLEMVEKAKEYIRAGDIFQVVLSQRFSAAFTLPAFSLYRALRRVNPAPFLCFLDFTDFQIVCSSPEILVRAADGKVTIRPIAGTRWRSDSKEEDERLATELLADEKECAEHLMLLDLGRNDVGRVAKTGSVSVTDRFSIERYSHVMHIVSNVQGDLDPKYDCIDALSAGFPAGTVSGAPKVRAMEIIDELEVDKRGIYGGCIGYFGSSGQMDTCIVLRTAIVKDGVMHVQAGAGVVNDSEPEYEYRECVNKSKALFRAAEEAARFASRIHRA